MYLPPRSVTADETPQPIADAVTFANELRPLTVEEFAELRSKIEAGGQRLPIDVDQHGRVLDGHHRLRVCVELGLPPVTRLVVVADDADALAHARESNEARRQLTREEKRESLKRSLIADPALSDRQHAAKTGVDHKTASAVRAELSPTGEIPQSENRVGADGRARPVSRLKAAARREAV
ncbi:MAG: ParB N-terminal domain-containing protein, partial [Candidatus Nanopelagicales bacterium]|nr:ParB N-terminal domain-containing protein [Candidatus Nanopelagicales bacterium]